MYIQLVSIHGLLRGSNIEMGRDADTGGQVRYVLELAKSLAERPEVDRVDLFTRRLRDKRVSQDYAAETERLGDACQIVRLPCAGGRYMRKEKLWPHLDDFVDEMITYTRREGLTPSVVHGHYADAGYVAREVSAVFDVPFVFTGHSLGKPKLDYLLGEGWTREKADKELAIDQRIRVEQECVAAADLVVTSTKHERDTQYGEYHRREDLSVSVIPPGTDLERFFPYYDYEVPGVEIAEHYKQARVRMTADLNRFYVEPDKPIILALCRPDRRKNIGALIDAYGKSKSLQAIANLAVFAGIRDDIEEMPDNERQVLTDMLLAMDRYNLYGKMAIPKRHDSEFEVPELYRLAASTRGVFVNTAFTELFGLTAIESSATGLPFVVTENGGPQDIAENCGSGLLVDVNQRESLTQAMLRLLTDEQLWDRSSANGVNRVRQHYSWETHAERFTTELKTMVARHASAAAGATRPAIGKRLASLDSLLVTDIDNTLLGDDRALEDLLTLLRENRGRIGFGVATGRSLELVQEALQQHGIEHIDVVISSVGAEVYYGDGFTPDRGWASQLRAKWRPDRVRDALTGLPFLAFQDRDHAQREFKVSCDLVGGVDPEEALPQVHAALAEKRVAYSLVFSHGSFLDVLPHRASKGKAVRYLARKWNFPIERVATAGDSGNDLDMLTGQTAGIVVGNYAPELEPLAQRRSGRTYFAEGRFAAGIIEGLNHYGLVNPHAAAAMTA
ncbi:MAG: HAD-IIB family hydrolase [Planctomycetota bacterium]